MTITRRERDEREAWAFLGILAVVTVAAIGLTGCAGAPVHVPEPVVHTIEVQVPVTRPCPALQRLGPAPAYPDTAEALRTAPTLFGRVQLLLAGRLLRMAREAAVTAAQQACEAPLQGR